MKDLLKNTVSSETHLICCVCFRKPRPAIKKKKKKSSLSWEFKKKKPCTKRIPNQCQKKETQIIKKSRKRNTAILQKQTEVTTLNLNLIKIYDKSIENYKKQYDVTATTGASQIRIL